MMDMRILIVDDMPDTVELFRLVLQLHQFNVETAFNGAEAVQRVAHNAEPFDAIVLDIEMPLMNGWQALGAIRELPQGKSPFVALFTGYSDSGDQQRAASAGADCVLIKPILPNALIETIRTGVKQRYSPESISLPLRPHPARTLPWA
jgi:CheY-like chemotaxis protein